MESGGRAEWEMRVEKNMLTYHKTTEKEKCFITEWKYPGAYAVYNSVPYEEQKKRGFGFANPANHFYSFYKTFRPLTVNLNVVPSTSADFLQSIILSRKISK